MNIRNAPTTRPSRHRGITLPEVAITLLATGMLVTGGLAISKRVSATATAQSDKSQLAALDEAVRRFAVREGRLPCPDANHDGREEGAGAACPAGLVVGELPWVTLELPSEPAAIAGRQLTYAVWRQAGTDLVNPTWSGTGDQQEAKRFLQTAAEASLKGIDPDQPNLMLRRQTSRRTCVDSLENPAYIISYEDPTLSTPSPHCLSGGNDRMVVATSRYELTGWWLRSGGQGFARDY